MFSKKVLLGILALALLVFVGSQVAAESTKTNTSDKNSVRRAKIADRKMAQWLERLAAIEAKMQKEKEAMASGEEPERRAKFLERLAALKVKMQKEIDVVASGAGPERRAKIAAQNTFSLSLDANSAAGDQAITSVNTSADQVVAIQVFGSSIQNATGFGLRFEYDASQVTYQGFDVGSVLPGSPQVLAEHGTNPTFVTIGIASFSGQATVSSGLVGTIRFLTTTGFSGTAVQLVRAELSRSGQSETVTLTARVELQVSTAPSPDFDGDGTVGISDFLQFVNHFGTSRGGAGYDAKYDLDGNDVIGISDFLIFVNNFGSQVPPSGGGSSGGSGTPPTSTPFDLHRDSDYPEGITYANNRFYVVDRGEFSTEGDEKVYAYTSSGQRDASADFDLHRENKRPGGITYANDRLYVADVDDDKVYVYTSSGQHDASADFDLHRDNGSSEGITYANDRFYVVDWIDGKVYVYTSSGQHDASADFDLHRDYNYPGGITYANNRLYVVDWIREKVYAYTSSGQRDASADFDLHRDNNYPGGITYANNRFYVVDPDDEKVYVYTSSGQSGSGSGGGSSSPDLIVESPSVSDNTLTTGQSFTLSATVRNQGTGSSAATTLRYYRSSNATISASDTEVGTDSVGGLSASGTSAESISLNAPSSAGTYYYGACVESVNGESDTDNNCSDAVSVTVSSSSGGGGGGGSGGSLGACRAGLVVNPSESCTYKAYTFSVSSSGRGSIAFFSTGTSLNLTGTINGVQWNFVASKNSGSNSWTIHTAN